MFMIFIFFVCFLLIFQSQFSVAIFSILLAAKWECEEKDFYTVSRIMFYVAFHTQTQFESVGLSFRDFETDFYIETTFSVFDGFNHNRLIAIVDYFGNSLSCESGKGEIYMTVWGFLKGVLYFWRR